MGPVDALSGMDRPCLIDGKRRQGQAVKPCSLRDGRPEGRWADAGRISSAPDIRACDHDRRILKTLLPQGHGSRRSFIAGTFPHALC